MLCMCHVYIGSYNVNSFIVDIVHRPSYTVYNSRHIKLLLGDSMCLILYIILITYYKRVVKILLNIFIGSCVTYKL